MEQILKQYAELLATVDNWFGRCLVSAGGAIACRDGCAGCCRGLFDITFLDACYLQSGFNLLPAGLQAKVLCKCRKRLADIKALWPEFASPYILNLRPEEVWEEIMPEGDDTPCVLLGDDGRCLIYAYRPMTCRLHGIPLVDVGGEIMDDAWCTLNFTNSEPLAMAELRGEFIQLFTDEHALFRAFTKQKLKQWINEVDTVIPTALLIDFDKF
jgi:Fe-S-cluster containining protein